MVTANSAILISVKECHVNYNFSIPKKQQRPWYEEFVQLVNQIDDVLKSLEIQRLVKDGEIKTIIENFSTQTYYWQPIPVNNINRPYGTTTSTSFVKLENGKIEFYTTGHWGMELKNALALYINAAIRAQRYSGIQGGELYMQIEFSPNPDETTPTPIWSLPVRSFNTDSYDPYWLNCAYILYYEEIPVFLFNNKGYYNFQTYFRSKDGGEVRVANDRITLLYKIRT